VILSWFGRNIFSNGKYEKVPAHGGHGSCSAPFFVFGLAHQPCPWCATNFRVRLSYSQWVGLQNRFCHGATVLVSRADGSALKRRVRAVGQRGSDSARQADTATPLVPWCPMRSGTATPLVSACPTECKRDCGVPHAPLSLPFAF
jgi:hypothetical protein